MGAAAQAEPSKITPTGASSSAAVSATGAGTKIRPGALSTSVAAQAGGYASRVQPGTGSLAAAAQAAAEGVRISLADLVAPATAAITAIPHHIQPQGVNASAGASGDAEGVRRQHAAASMASQATAGATGSRVQFIAGQAPGTGQVSVDVRKITPTTGDAIAYGTGAGTPSRIQPGATVPVSTALAEGTAGRWVFPSGTGGGVSDGAAVPSRIQPGTIAADASAAGSIWASHIQPGEVLAPAAANVVVYTTRGEFESGLAKTTGSAVATASRTQSAHIDAPAQAQAVPHGYKWVFDAGSANVSASAEGTGTRVRLSGGDGSASVGTTSAAYRINPGDVAITAEGASDAWASRITSDEVNALSQAGVVSHASRRAPSAVDGHAQGQAAVDGQKNVFELSRPSGTAGLMRFGMTMFGGYDPLFHVDGSRGAYVTATANVHGIRDTWIAPITALAQATAQADNHKIQFTQGTGAAQADTTIEQLLRVRFGQAALGSTAAGQGTGVRVRLLFSDLVAAAETYLQPHKTTFTGAGPEAAGTASGTGSVIYRPTIDTQGAVGAVGMGVRWRLADTLAPTAGSVEALSEAIRPVATDPADSLARASTWGRRWAVGSVGAQATGSVSGYYRVNEYGPAPGIRTHTPADQEHTVTVSAEDRSITIAGPSRVLWVIADNREAA